MPEIQDAFWTKLKGVYKNHERGDEDWAKEEPMLRKIFPQIQQALAGWYELDDPINRGGAGLVIKVRDLRLSMATANVGRITTTYRALKLPRPISEREGLLIAMLNKEAAFLASLTHSNVIKLYAFGTVMVDPLVRPVAFTHDKIRDVSAFVNKLRQHEDVLSQFLWNKLPHDLQLLLTNYDASQPNAAETELLLLKMINELVRTVSIYNDPRFNGMRLPPEMTKSLNQNLAGQDFSQLNNAFLEQAYPEELSPKPFTFPYYVMDFIEDALTPVQYAGLPNTTLSDDLLRIYSDILEGHCYLTELQVRHNDPKPANVLVDKKGRAIISDLGSAKRIDSKDSSTIIPFTRGYAPPDKIARATGPATDDDRVRLEIAPKDIPLRWDIFSVGLSLLEILDAFCKTHPQDLKQPRSKYIILYLRLLIGRMLGSDAFHIETALSLPRCFYEQLQYLRFEDAKHDLDKMLGKVALAVLVPELDLDSKRVVQCPMSGTVPLTERVSALLEHPAMRRLMSVTQLGLLAYIYPNASHSRYEHSLGAYGNCVRMLHSLWQDQQNPIFRLVMNKDDLETCLLAVLFHDLGQYPLAHDLEEADAEFFHHEDLLEEFLNKPVGGKALTLADLIDRHWGTGTADRVKRICKCRPHNLHAPIKDRILHTIVDGPLDADKLDYIARDSSRMGVSYGSILDYERIFSSLTVVPERKGDDLFAVIGIHEKGRTGAECVAFARYALFAAAYWHHTSRSIKAMVHRSVWEICERGSEFRSQFITLLLDNKLPQIQLTFFAETSQYDRPIWPGVAPTDLQMLLWIWEKTSLAGRRLIENLIDRKLFKRAFVVSGEKHNELVKSLQKIRRQSETNVAQMKLLDELMADKITKHLSRLSPFERQQTDVFSQPITQSFEERARAKEILILVDIPKPDISKLDELRCLSEVDRWKPITEQAKPFALQHSPVWSSLIDSFGEGASKIRVFVHPDFAETVRSIPREDVEGMLSGCSTEVLG